jgi:hypothetical protein
MFAVNETEAASIRTAFEQDGELSAGIEVRRLFPGITDGARAREMARVIAGWAPRPAVPAAVLKFPRAKREPHCR